MTASQSIDQALKAVAEALKREPRVLITCHVNPDGDAIGCLIALHRSLTQLGADSVMYISSTEPVAPEWHFLKGLAEVVRGDPPADSGTRTLVCVDCGNAERVGNDQLVAEARRIINIDHHADNTRFGEINLVVGGASSTAEILYFILEQLGAEITPEIAEALYTGILVDSGRFQYSSASPATFRIAADLIGRGVDHTAIFRAVYERVPLSKTRLFCRMFEHLTLALDGRLAVAVLEQADFDQTGTSNESTEGLVDNLRAIDGVMVACLVYARTNHENEGEPFYRLSLRSSSAQVNVQRIARLKGGGGHAQAAGASVSGETASQIIGFLRTEVGRALSETDSEMPSRGN
ncbi:MAG: DHH family phosphoesterase [Thermoleophilia bacterium]